MIWNQDDGKYSSSLKRPFFPKFLKYKEMMGWSSCHQYCFFYSIRLYSIYGILVTVLDDSYLGNCVNITNPSQICNKIKYKLLALCKKGLYIFQASIAIGRLTSVILPTITAKKTSSSSILMLLQCSKAFCGIRRSNFLKYRTLQVKLN